MHNCTKTMVRPCMPIKLLHSVNLLRDSPLCGKKVIKIAIFPEIWPQYVAKGELAQQMHYEDIAEFWFTSHFLFSLLLINLPATMWG